MRSCPRHPAVAPTMTFPFPPRAEATPKNPSQPPSTFSCLLVVLQSPCGSRSPPCGGGSGSSKGAGPTGRRSHRPRPPPRRDGRIADCPKGQAWAAAPHHPRRAGGLGGRSDVVKPPPPQPRRLGPKAKNSLRNTDRNWNFSRAINTMRACWILVCGISVTWRR